LMQVKLPALSIYLIIQSFVCPESDRPLVYCDS
jgi:hypothetical protein